MASLDQWHKALRNLAKKEPNLTEKSITCKKAKFKAWQGDRLLSYAAARSIVHTSIAREAGPATRLTNQALSNDFLAKHTETIVPHSTFPKFKPQGAKNNRELGTFIEYLVERIGNDSGQEKVEQLARWLLTSALKEKNYEGGIHNNKVTADTILALLEVQDGQVKSEFEDLGGKVTSNITIRVIAEAELNGTSITVNSGGKKKAAERKAIRDLLRKWRDALFDSIAVKENCRHQE